MVKNRYILVMGWSLVLMLIAVSVCGILVNGLYDQESGNFRMQAMGQDLLDLFLICPILMFSVIMTRRGNRTYAMLLAAIILFIAYSLAIYCFALHFNPFFLLYCLAFGLSVYSFIYLTYSIFMDNKTRWFNNRFPVKGFSFYLIGTAIVFYVLWLSEILPAIVQHKIPASLKDTDLLTNPVHVLDLSFLLPALLLDGIFLMKRNPFAFILTPVLIFFCVLMDLNIGFLSVYMHQSGRMADYAVASFMGFLVIAGIYLFYRFIRHLNIQIPVKPDYSHMSS